MSDSRVNQSRKQARAAKTQARELAAALGLHYAIVAGDADTSAWEADK